MADSHVDTPPDPSSTEDQPAQPPTEQEALAGLQQENESLRQQVARLNEQANGAELEGELQQAQEANDSLRTQLSRLAVQQALQQAADDLGISREAAGTYQHRFRCVFDERGDARVDPNPTELLLREAKSNPLLRKSAEQRRMRRTAVAAAAGGLDASTENPAALLAALDRHPARKAEFIRRHGSEALIGLARRARQNTRSSTSGSSS